jgi:alkyl hydroperoxide reductase subunit AhpC
VLHEEFIEVDLAELRGGYTVLVALPAAFTFVCATEIPAFDRKQKEFRALNASVLFLTTDSKHTLLAWSQLDAAKGGVPGNLNFPLVSDIGGAISRSFGFLVTDPSDDMFGAALRATYIIDERGIVRHMSIGDDHVGRNENEILRLIRGFQHADREGVVCQAGWSGEQDRKLFPDPKLSKAFFAAEHKHDDDDNTKTEL